MYSKIIIRFDLEVLTGMHIGGSSAFSAIGAVDSPVIRDPLSGQPIVPGSSLKGKLRTLLARSITQDYRNMPEFWDDDPIVLRMFGSTACRSRLQFSDAFISNANTLKTVGFTEVKSENVIRRSTAEAMPRQIERVVAGTVFAETIVYDTVSEAETWEDLQNLAKAMKLLQMDYLGGHGSRGSGRVSLKNFRISAFGAEADCEGLKKLFDEVAAYELLCVSAPV